MKKYILKVKSGLDNIEYGTGIAIAENLVIVPSHVVIDEKYTFVLLDQEINASIELKTNDFIILKINSSLADYASIFSDDEIIDDDTKWMVHGYLSSIQYPHEITGKGIHMNTIHTETEIWDCILQNVLSGVKNDYSGLSGSPVFSNNRIIGILQKQESVDGGATELKMASVNMFKELLPFNAISSNEYKAELLKNTNGHTKEKIDYNKSIKKYIPDIYVEEWHYKEMVRYFADPWLFGCKALSELFRYDWSNINNLLQKQNLPTIDFHKYENILSSKRFIDEIIELCDWLKEVVSIIEKAEKNDNGLSIEQYSKKWTTFNNQIKWYLRDIAELLEMIPIKYLLLLKEAGQGKTNFLCDFTQNFLMKKGYYVLYFNAKDFSDNPINTVIQFFTINGSYNLDYIKKVMAKEFQRTKRPFVIVIDGLNENSHINNFGSIVKDFLEKCEEFPFVKVLMTTRIEFYQEKFGVLSNGFYHSKFLSIQMRRNYEKFDDRIFRGYLAYFDVDIIESSLMNSTYKKLTHDVLLLRFFCEVNSHKKSVNMYDVYVYEVFEKYTTEKCSKYSKPSTGIVEDRLSVLFDRMISKMIDNDEYSSVCKQEFTEDEIDLLNEMIDSEVIFKGEEYKKTGLVTNIVETVGFTFDEYRDYCITNYIIKKYDENDLLKFMQHIEQIKSPICEGVQKYLFYLSHTKYKSELKEIIKKILTYETFYWKHIWSIDEQYIDDHDIDKCREQIIRSSDFMTIVIKNMVVRHDCNFYKKINIFLLMEILDELSISSYEVFSSITQMFPFKKSDYDCDFTPRVLYINSILQYLIKFIEDDILIEQYVQLLKFTVYIFQNEQYEICEVWKLFHKKYKAETFDILKNMNSHNCYAIQKNTACIISSILQGDEDFNLQELLDNNSYQIKSRTEMQRYFKSFLGELEKYYEDNTD